MSDSYVPGPTTEGPLTPTPGEHTEEGREGEEVRWGGNMKGRD